MKKIAVFFAFIFIFSSCSLNLPEQNIKRSEYMLGTFINLNIYDSDVGEDVVDNCFELVSQYEKMFSYYDSSSELYQLNQSAYKHPFKVTDEMYDIITESLDYCRKTDGAFDIGLGKVIEIWDDASGEGIPPDEALLSPFAGFRGYEHIVVNEIDKTVYFSDERVSIHLGACAKGFVQDKAVTFLKECGVKSALLDFGGSIYALGTKDSKPFSIGITDPTSESELAGAVQITDLSVVTSGNYRRFFEYNGVVYHHIIDSATAFPSQSDINGVSVICESAFKGDCLSTASFVLGAERAEALLSDENCGYVIITDESVRSDGVIFKNEK